MLNIYYTQANIERLKRRLNALNRRFSRYKAFKRVDN